MFPGSMQLVAASLDDKELAPRDDFGCCAEQNLKPAFTVVHFYSPALWNGVRGLR